MVVGDAGVVREQNIIINCNSDHGTKFMELIKQNYEIISANIQAKQLHTKYFVPLHEKTLKRIQYSYLHVIICNAKTNSI